MSELQQRYCADEDEKEKMALRKAWKKGAEKISSHETERDWLGDDLVSR